MKNINASLKRYNLSLPQELFDDLQQIADSRQTTVVEILRRFIRLGLIVHKIDNTPGAELLIHEGDAYQRIIIL